MRVRDVCTPRKETVSEKCACDTNCVYTHRRRHSSCHYVGAKPESEKKIFRFHHTMSNLISPTRTCSTSLLSTNCQMYELMLLGFPRHALLLILGDAFVWNLHLRFGSPRRIVSNCMRAKKASRPSGTRSSR